MHQFILATSSFYLHLLDAWRSLLTSVFDHHIWSLFIVVLLLLSDSACAIIAALCSRLSFLQVVAMISDLPCHAVNVIVQIPYLY